MQVRSGTPKVSMNTQFSTDEYDALEAEARRRGCSKGQIIREALAYYLASAARLEPDRRAS